MKISDRFTDYGLIGGFFWLLQCGVISIVIAPNVEWHKVFQILTGDLLQAPKETQPYIPLFVAFLGALALIMLFVTGLILDLLGSAIYRAQELPIFVANLKRNKLWLERIVDQNKEYIQDDWTLLIDSPGAWYKDPTMLLIVLKSLAFWNSRYRRDYIELIKKLRSGLRSAYTRMQSFLLIYVLLTSGVDKIELLNTQINLWNTSRAIAAAMYIIAFEILFGVVSAPIFYLDDPKYILLLVISLLAQIILTVISMAVVSSAFGRVCSTLFALAYIVAEKIHVTDTVK